MCLVWLVLCPVLFAFSKEAGLIALGILFAYYFWIKKDHEDHTPPTTNYTSSQSHYSLPVHKPNSYDSKPYVSDIDRRLARDRKKRKQERREKRRAEADARRRAEEERRREESRRMRDLPRRLSENGISMAKNQNKNSSRSSYSRSSRSSGFGGGKSRGGGGGRSF